MEFKSIAKANETKNLLNSFFCFLLRALAEKSFILLRK